MFEAVATLQRISAVILDLTARRSKGLNYESKTIQVLNGHIHHVPA